MLWREQGSRDEFSEGGERSKEKEGESNSHSFQEDMSVEVPVLGSERLGLEPD